MAAALGAGDGTPLVLPDPSNHDLTRLLSPLQLDSIRIHYVAQSALDDFVSMINSTERFARFFEVETIESMNALHIKIIQAWESGRASTEQVASFCLFRAASTQLMLYPKHISTYIRSGEKTLQLNLIDHLSSNAILLSSTHKIGPRMYHIESGVDHPETDSLLQKALSLGNQSFSTLKAQIAMLPPSEQIFYTFPLPVEPIESWSNMFSGIIKVIPSLLKPVAIDFETPPREPIKLTPHILVLPSFSMFKLAQKLKYESDAVPMIPVLGRCNVKTIEEFWKEDRCVFNIGAKGLELPAEADGRYAGPFGFSMHDAYHAYRKSEQTKLHRAALRYIVYNILDPAIRLHPDRQDLKDLRWKIIDGELHFARLRKHCFGIVFDCMAWPADIKRDVIKDMVSKPDYWSEHFNIIYTDLTKEQQHAIWESAFFYEAYPSYCQIQFAIRLKLDQPSLTINQLGCVLVWACRSEDLETLVFLKDFSQYEEIPSIYIGMAYIHLMAAEKDVSAFLDQLNKHTQFHQISPNLLHLIIATGIVEGDREKISCFFSHPNYPKLTPSQKGEILVNVTLHNNMELFHVLEKDPAYELIPPNLFTEVVFNSIWNGNIELFTKLKMHPIYLQIKDILHVMIPTGVLLDEEAFSNALLRVAKCEFLEGMQILSYHPRYKTTSKEVTSQLLQETSGNKELFRFLLKTLPFSSEVLMEKGAQHLFSDGAAATESGFTKRKR